MGKDLPEIKIAKSKFAQGLALLDLLAGNNIVPSKSEARRAIKSNGIKINDTLVHNEKKIISLDDLNKKNFLKLSYGKKKHYIIRLI